MAINFFIKCIIGFLMSYVSLICVPVQSKQCLSEYGTRWHHTLKVWHALVPHGARGIYLWHEFRNGLLLQLKFHYWLDSAPRCLWWMFKDRVGCLPYYRIIWHPVCRYDRQWQQTAPYGFIMFINFQMAINLIVKCIMVSPHVLCVCDWCTRTH